eukprot:m.30215 g.30215  ORF g.30215 m.30215 type:complete len:308 (-) comp14514_c0_seq1:286-1209(-)
MVFVVLLFIFGCAFATTAPDYCEKPQGACVDWFHDSLLVGGSKVPSRTYSDDDWVMTWEDDFLGSTINASNWNVAQNFTHGDRELQLYLAEDVYVENGTLVLRTRKNPTYYGSKLYNYTSGWVDTEDKFYQKYGKFAVRAKLPDPKFDSIWPAHWLMPEPKTSQPPNVCWPVGGEIDIMESWGGDYNNSIKGTFHFAQECGKDLRSGPNGQYPNITGGAAPIDFSQDYHIFSVVWDEERIQWYVDGNFFWERHQNDQPAPHGARIPFFPFYFILNTAISWWSKPPVGPDEPTVYHIIDYVRAYELKQ